MSIDWSKDAAAVETHASRAHRRQGWIAAALLLRRPQSVCSEWACGALRSRNPPRGRSSILLAPRRAARRRADDPRSACRWLARPRCSWRRSRAHLARGRLRDALTRARSRADRRRITPGGRPASCRDSAPTTQRRGRGRGQQPRANEVPKVRIPGIRDRRSLPELRLRFLARNTVAKRPPRLPLNVRDGAGRADGRSRSELALSMRDDLPALDLDRLIGGSPTPTDMTEGQRAAGLAQALVTEPPSCRVGAPSVVSAPPAVRSRQATSSARREACPFSHRRSDEADDTPLITKPRPVRPPLSVRRATPDVPRLRPRPFRPRRDESALNFQADDIDRIPDEDHEAEIDVVCAASRDAREPSAGGPGGARWEPC